MKIGAWIHDHGDLARYHQLGLEIEALCVGNELREGGDEPDRKRFTARLFGSVMAEFVGLIREIDTDYGGKIRGLYFYEWRDNYHHPKIWNIEQSPIHTAFGLCDTAGEPKFDMEDIL